VIALGPEVCRDFALASKLEWLETNGIGGYASSTIVLANTRRYHGLLVTATNPPVGRVLLLAKIEESLIVGGDRFDLASNQYPDIVYPEGYRFLEAFRLDPYPVFTYRVPGAVLEKSLFLAHGEDTLVVWYRLMADRPALLEARPLVAYRSFHDLSSETERVNRSAEDSGGLLRVTPFDGMPSLCFTHGGTFQEEGYWYRNFEYVEEAYRGYDFREDLFAYGSWRRLLEPGRDVPLIVSTSPAAEGDAYRLRAAERQRRAGARAPGLDGAAAGALALAADQLLVRRRDNLASVMTGYPWHPEGGRDAAIALPGLALATGRFLEAREILRNLVHHAREGLAPVAFSEDGAGEPSSHASADTSLWIFVAVHEYLRATGDDVFVRTEMAGPLLDVLRRYAEGTLHGIAQDADGLVRASAPGVPLTWMNARVGSWVATERAGKPVEVAALWINALRIGAEIARLSGSAGASEGEAARLDAAAERARAAFRRAFWDPDAGSLRDIADGADDPAVRPNQAIALGLPYPVIADAEARRALAVVRSRLWTPCGLRTLDPADPRYRARCVGDAWLREGAAHQGTVWPWLIGPYLRAVARVDGRDAARAEAAPSLERLAQHLREAGLGSVSEFFDGEAPHAPRGAVGSALSVAECLRIFAEAER
jgi:predicted glycogen debranching enzyme